MPKTFTWFPLFVAVACGGGAPEAESPAPRPSTAPAAPIPSAEVAPASTETPKTEAATAAKLDEKKPALAPKLEKPKSEATIGGKSVSDVDGLLMLAEAKKLGWVKDGTGVGGGVIGPYEQFRFDIEKGGMKGYIEVVRPTANPGEAGSVSMTPPVELKARREKEGAATELDEVADVIVVVSVEGKTADAKKLLGQLVKVAKPKAKKATPKATQSVDKPSQ